MSLITLPSTSAVGGASFELSVSQEVLTTAAGVAQVTSYPDRRWNLRLDIVPQFDSDLRAWMTALARLADRSNWFAYGPPHYSGPSTGYSGSNPSVVGNDQLGDELDVDGLPNSTAILLAGDFISFDTTSAAGNTNRQLNFVTANVTSNGSGEATLNLALPIRQAPADNATVNVLTPSALFMLASPRGGIPSLRPGMFSEFTIEAVERIFP